MHWPPDIQSARIRAQMLKIEALTKMYGQVAAVDNVTFDVPAGQMGGIIGRSGAGKSTLLRMINRLTDPTSGRIWCDDVFAKAVDVGTLRGRRLREWRGRCAMVFQQFNLVPRLPVLTNVLIGRVGYRATLPSLLGLFSDEDRALTLADPEAFIGLVHPLELGEETQRAWARVLGDYEILQPFDQLGRAAFRATNAELGAMTLDRSVLDALRAADLDQLKPIEALNLLAELKKQIT